ncbi:MAG: hypothetical protein D6767_03295 [Candidatus Hydrogenedentota bacterium]|nr:MAG: hypothetical protein D6767_03295 [Candidatus Hydrogenedentota bacterium]
MIFICRLLEDCLKSDGKREYLFQQTLPITLPEELREKLELQTQKNVCIEIQKMATKTYVRILHPYYKIYFFLPSKNIRVEFEDFHPPHARSILEKIFSEM